MRLIKFAGDGTLNQLLNLAKSAPATSLALKQFKSAAPFISPRVRAPIERTTFAKRVVIGNSWNCNWQADSGMAKPVPFWSRGAFPLVDAPDTARRASESSSCNVLTPQFLFHAKSTTFRP